MDLEQFREYCLSKVAATESMPFGEGILVFKVDGKIFALATLDEIPATVNLNVIPMWRSRYAIDTNKSNPVIT
jgi:predicted DNA-binding protein (MmcQ/YjbR family)